MLTKRIWSMGVELPEAKTFNNLDQDTRRRLITSEEKMGVALSIWQHGVRIVGCAACWR